jgi:hypothetical protein
MIIEIAGVWVRRRDVVADRLRVGGFQILESVLGTAGVENAAQTEEESATNHTT